MKRKQTVGGEDAGENAGGRVGADAAGLGADGVSLGADGGRDGGGDADGGDGAKGGARLGAPPLTKGKKSLPLAPGMQESAKEPGRDTEGVARWRADPAVGRMGHSRGLLLVGLFKLSKAVFFTALGAGALHLVNRDLGSVLLHVIDALRIDPERHFVTVLLNHVGFIDPHELRRAGVLSFLYAIVCVVEGAGLVLEKRWAEYFTVILTLAGLPWEGFELLRKFSSYKLVLLAINFGVLLYLLWILKRRKAEGEI
ncbi:MAG: DUF2127 domain-containing protein [Acidobacteriaceae bacterium]